MAQFKNFVASTQGAYNDIKDYAMGTQKVRDVKFNNQAYLNSYLDEIIEKLDPTYKYVDVLDTSSKSFAEIMALLTGKSDLPSLSNLKTHQYNSLIPKIRLYRVNAENDSEYEFKFVKDHRLSKSLKTYLGEEFFTGNNCGIKSINWILAGTNPVSAEKTIEVKIEFYFDSINSFSGGDYDQMLKFWNSPNSSLLNSPFDDEKSFTTTNYWSLIYHPRIKSDQYDSPFFRIKAIVGWEQIDPLILSEIFSDKENINQELLESELIMYLNLVQHSFEFNEDGSIKLTANYIANLENTFSSQRFDLLRGLKESLNKLKDLSYNTLESINNLGSLDGGLTGLGNELQGASLSDEQNLRAFEIRMNNDQNGYNNISLSQLEKKIKFLKYLKENNGNLVELNNELVKCGKIELLTELNSLTKINYSVAPKFDQLLTEFESKITEFDTIIQKTSTTIKLYHYSKLIQTLLKEKNGNKFSLYTINLNSDSVNQWLQWKNGIITEKPPLTNDVTDASESQVNEASRQASKLGLERDKNESEWLLGGLNEPNTFDAWRRQSESLEMSINNKEIYFTTIGHVVDSCFEIIKLNLKNTSIELKEFEKNKILFSTFSQAIPAPIPFADKILSIAAIPIEFNFLIKFLNEVIYERGVTELSLFQFLKELTIKVAEPALESREVLKNEVNKHSNISISSTIVSLGSDVLTEHPLSNFYKPNTKIIDLSQINKDYLKDLYLNNSNLRKHTLIPFNYYIIYDRFNKDFTGIGKKLEDEKKGIYHYTIAQNYGLVKSINFKKIDQPFLKESKSVGKKTVYLGQFRDLYNANIKMIGNNIYHPGMILFIRPSIEFGNVISNDSNSPTFSQITGVGGYYTVIKTTSDITDDGYTTNLECVFHSNDGLQPEENRQDCNYLEMTKAGLYNSDGSVSGVSALVMQTLEEIAKDEKEKRKEEAAKTPNINVPGIPLIASVAALISSGENKE